MAVFIELVTDAFDETFRDTVGRTQGVSSNRTSRAGRPMARRPVRGIEIKDDTYASLKVILPNGKPLPLLDSSSATGLNDFGYTNFILQSVQEARMEKSQIVETFGDSYIFFFGESPRFLEVSSMLINSHDFNWRAEWWHNYDNYLRGTKLVELGARCYMFWDDNVVEGYILQAQASETSQEPYSVQLSFKFFVTKYQNISLHNVQNFPIRSSVMVPEGIELTNANSFDQVQNYYREGAAGARRQDAVPRLSSLAGNMARSDYGRNTGLHDVVRGVPSIVQDPTVWNELVGRSGLVDLAHAVVNIGGATRGMALRGQIAENIDEYVQGGQSSGYSAYFGSVSNTQRGIPWSYQDYVNANETEDLDWDAIRSMDGVGADINDPQTIRDLGLGPNFSPGYMSNAYAFAGARATASAGVGAGVSMGASASASASFSPMVNASVSATASTSFGMGAQAGVVAGASAGYGVSASARAGYYANAHAETNSFVVTRQGYYADRRSSISAIYGRSDYNRFDFNEERDRYVAGVGDQGYGYASAYGGVGFGMEGFGDFGGKAFGSSNRRGDPGYIQPSAFAFGGVSAHRAEYNAFLRPRRDHTALTEGPVFGGTSVLGGASITVTGQSSAFALVAVDGELEEWVIEESRNSYEGRLAMQQGVYGGYVNFQARAEGTTGAHLGYPRHSNRNSGKLQTIPVAGLAAGAASVASDVARGVGELTLLPFRPFL